MAEYEVSVTKERFEMTKSAVTGLWTGERLPCDATSRGCAGARHAYSWTVPETMDCPLQVILYARMTRDTGSAILIDLPAQVVVEVTSQTPQTFGTCPGSWYTTTETQIVVMFNASDALSINQVQPEEVDLFLSIAMSRWFLEYRLDMQGATEGRLMEQHECR